MPRFTACPPHSRKCVSTLNTSGYPHLEPIDYGGDSVRAITAIKESVASFAGTKVVEETATYLRATFTTPVMRFTDTVQFEVEAGQIHFRSESVPYAKYDLGANRKRMTTLRGLFDTDSDFRTLRIDGTSGT